MFKVTNNNPTDFKASYDGQAYCFVAGLTMTAPDDAVNHIFGLTQKSKREVILRHGWAKPTEPLQAGLEVLKNFKFEKLNPQYEEPAALVNVHRPAPVVHGAGGDDGEDPKLPSVARGPGLLDRVAASKRAGAAPAA